MVSTYFPDIDSRFSKLGKGIVFRPLQFLFGHRKVIHSFLFLFLISIPVFYLSKVVFYGFVIGYGLHLFLDCFTVMGIKPFYPFEFKIRGFIKTGSFFESVLFYFVLFFDVLIFLQTFK